MSLGLPPSNPVFISAGSDELLSFSCCCGCEQIFTFHWISSPPLPKDFCVQVRRTSFVYHTSCESFFFPPRLCDNPPSRGGNFFVHRRFSSFNLFFFPTLVSLFFLSPDGSSSSPPRLLTIHEQNLDSCDVPSFSFTSQIIDFCPPPSPSFRNASRSFPFPNCTPIHPIHSAPDCSSDTLCRHNTPQFILSPLDDFAISLPPTHPVFVFFSYALFSFLRTASDLFLSDVRRREILGSPPPQQTLSLLVLFLMMNFFLSGFHFPHPRAQNSPLIFFFEPRPF